MVNTHAIFVKILLIPLLLSVTACHYTPARTVKELSIKISGISIESEERNTSEGCKEFQPTVEQVKKHFTYAYPAETYLITTDRYSPCYAAGSLTYSDDTSVKWTLYSSGGSTIIFPNGEDVTMNHRNTPWVDVTACSYGLGDEEDEC